METRISNVETNQAKMLDEMLGTAHALTGERQGGMRGDMGVMAEAISRLEYKANNGGVNAKVKLTFWQKITMASLPAVTLMLQALLERM